MPGVFSAGDVEFDRRQSLEATETTATGAVRPEPERSETPEAVAHCPGSVMDIHIYLHDGPDARVTRRLDEILTRLGVLTTQGAHIMATVQELSDELDSIKTAVDAVKATVTAQIQQIADLQAQIAAGTPVSQQQLDELDAKADSILASLNG